MRTKLTLVGLIGLLLMAVVPTAMMLPGLLGSVLTRVLTGKFAFVLICRTDPEGPHKRRQWLGEQ
jgi:hypothetical protein